MQNLTLRKPAARWLVAALLAVAVAAAPAAQTTVPPPPPPQQQTTPPPPPPVPPGAPSDIIAIQQAARPPQYLPEIITEAQLRSHMEFLASDALQGRAGGTRDEWIAATYVGSQLRRVGVEPMGDNGTYVQAIEMVVEEAVTPPVLTVGGKAFTHGKEMIVQSLGTPLNVNGPLIKFQRGVAVPTGAIVLLPSDATAADRTAVAPASLILTAETPQIRNGWEAAAARMPALPTRALKLGPPSTPRTTRIVLDSLTHIAISAMADAAPVSFAAEVKALPSTFTWNALGKLTGSAPNADNDVLVLSAHLDHIGPRPPQPGVDTIFNGADDDASGTVAVLALAEALAFGKRPRRTVIFALFGSEERGGYGAGYFVDRPVVPLSSIAADLQFEMLGRPDKAVPPQNLWLTGYGLSNLGIELAKHGAKLVADPHPDQQFFTRSDNIRFARRGVVAHTVSSYNLHTDYHQPSDEIRLIDFAHMTAAIKAMLEPIRWLADSSWRPEWIPGGCPAPCR